MTLMEQFADPGLMQSMTVSEKLAGAGITTIMGMGITFLVLFLLWGCISVMGMATTHFGGGPGDGSGRGKKPHRHCARPDRGPGGKHAAAAAGAAADAAAVPAVPEGELIAVITAAVSAYTGREARIRRIRDKSGDSWSQIGRWESMR